MTRHWADTDETERRVRKHAKIKKRCDLTRQHKMSAGRLFDRRSAATGNAMHYSMHILREKFKTFHGEGTPPPFDQPGRRGRHISQSHQTFSLFQTYTL